MARDSLLRCKAQHAAPQRNLFAPLQLKSHFTLVRPRRICMGVRGGGFATHQLQLLKCNSNVRFIIIVVIIIFSRRVNSAQKKLDKTRLAGVTMQMKKRFNGVMRPTKKKKK